MTVLRVAIGLVVCLSLMLRLAPPFELAVNYVVLTWGTQYVWPIVIYFGAAVGLFLALGGVLSALAGLGRAGALVAAVFGLCCMVFLIIRQPFFSIAPTTPSVGQVALAYMHSLAAPLGTVLGALLVVKLDRWRRRMPPNTSLERTRER